MSGSSNKRMVRRSAWSQITPSYRLLFGFCFICIIGLMGQTPKSIFDIQIIWPHAALWAAVGWASVGLAVRPMLLLCVLGIAQDISFDGPIAVFWIVNLIAYGIAVWLNELFDVEKDPVKALMVAGVAMGGGFVALWLLASGTADHGVRIFPRVQEWLLTLILFVPLAPMFRLGGLPGNRLGAN